MLGYDSAHLLVKYDNKIYYVPSPYLIERQLKDNNSHYNPDCINISNNWKKYESSLKKALNLGIYGADFGYLCLFNQPQTRSYYQAIKGLSEELNILQQINKELFINIKDDKKQPDSLIYNLSLVFYETDNYLKKSMQGDIAALIVTGGWIESLYILVTEYQLHPTEILYNSICFQKYNLENIIQLLKPYYDKDAEYKSITDELIDLSFEYDVLDYQYTYSDSLTTQKHGVIRIHNQIKLQNDSKSILNINQKIIDLRNKAVS
jgi:hypothetical protein